MTQTLHDALLALNPDDDAHWTKAGQPNLNVLKEATGHPVKRAEVVGVAGDFTRDDALARNGGSSKANDQPPDTDPEPEAPAAGQALPVEPPSTAPQPPDEHALNNGDNPYAHLQRCIASMGPGWTKYVPMMRQIAEQFAGQQDVILAEITRAYKRGRIEIK